jgi:hypothetical protein
VVETALVARHITETVFPLVFATYAKLLHGDDVPVTCAEPEGIFAFEVVIVVVEVVEGARPVTVIRPVPLMATDPDAVAVPAYV